MKGLFFLKRERKKRKKERKKEKKGRKKGEKREKKGRKKKMQNWYDFHEPHNVGILLS